MKSDWLLVAQPTFPIFELQSPGDAKFGDSGIKIVGLTAFYTSPLKVNR